MGREVILSEPTVEVFVCRRKGDLKRGREREKINKKWKEKQQQQQKIHLFKDISLAIHFYICR